MTKKRVSAKDVTAVILAAGTGDRLGGDLPKQYAPLGDRDDPTRTVIDLLLESYAASGHVANICIVASDEHFDIASAIADRYGRTRVVVGGATRHDSVYLGVQAVETAVTILHDAARPLLHQPALAVCIEKFRCGAQAVLTATQPYASMLMCTENGPVSGVVERDRIAFEQCPVAYYTADIREAFDIAAERGLSFRDEPAMMMGIRPDIISETAPGHRFGFKLTYPEDLEVLATYRRYLDLQ